MTAPTPTFTAALRRLYAVRFVLALAWAALLFSTASDRGTLLTVLVVAYPLVDAAAVLWQLRAPGRGSAARWPEWLNVVVSVAVAVALGWAAGRSFGAVLAVWGVWAVGAGAPQLVTALQRRRSGGQVPQILSGGISVLAGLGFLSQASQSPSGVAGIGGYAVLGGVFFLVSALRLTQVLRTEHAAG